MPERTEPNLITVRPFQLLQWKHAIRLEEQGIKVARKSVRNHAAKHFGVTRKEALGCVEVALEACKEAGIPMTDAVSIQMD